VEGGVRPPDVSSFLGLWGKKKEGGGRSWRGDETLERELRENEGSHRVTKRKKKGERKGKK